MTLPPVINLREKLATFSDHWNPRIIGGYNGNELRLVKLKGTFTWHSHPDSEELFMPIDGRIRIEFRDGLQELKPGELLVVPAGVEHRTVTEEECSVLVLNREGEPNTGSQPSVYTRSKLESI